MKYHGFESPIDWSQYLIQKADKHEYEPSEPGKRVEALLEKLYLPQNSYSYAKFPQWFADSSDKGTEEEQVRYVMNTTLCVSKVKHTLQAGAITKAQDF